jgi:hypothetical protein
VIDEQSRRPSELLAAFMQRLRLGGYEPPRDRESMMRFGGRRYSVTPRGD